LPSGETILNVCYRLKGHFLSWCRGLSTFNFHRSCGSGIADGRTGCCPRWLSWASRWPRFHITTSKWPPVVFSLAPDASLPPSVPLCSQGVFPLQRTLGGQVLGNCKSLSLLTESPDLTACTTTSCTRWCRRCSTSKAPPHDECSEAAAQIPAIQTGGHPRPIKQLCVSLPHKCLC
jgi:hypothetical protein